jgi:transposase
MKLTDAQWQLIQRLFETDESPRRGRPSRPARDVLDGVLWILKTGARWKDLPPRYPSYQTCHRRFQQWVRDGTLEAALRVLAQDLKDRGGLDVREAFIDGTFSGAKKGALALGKPSAARAPNSWQSQTATVFLSPLGLRVLRRMK